MRAMGMRIVSNTRHSCAFLISSNPFLLFQNNQSHLLQIALLLLDVKTTVGIQVQQHDKVLVTFL